MSISNLFYEKMPEICQLDDGSINLKFVERSTWLRDLGASNIGTECKRSVWLDHRWCIEETDRSFDERVYRMFYRGHFEEEILIKELIHAGHKVWQHDLNGKQFEFKSHSGHFKCHLDGIILYDKRQKCTFEAKMLNDKGFKLITDKGLKKAKPLYYTQVQLGMHFSGIKKCLFIYRNKNDDSTKKIFIDYNEQEALDFAKTIDIILNANEPIQKLKPNHSECFFCDYKQLCHGKEIPKLNCRNCIYSTPTMDGDAKWICEKFNNKDLTKEEQNIGCNAHLLIPSIYNEEILQAGKDFVLYQDGAINLSECENKDEMKKKAKTMNGFRPFGITKQKRK